MFHEAAETVLNWTAMIVPWPPVCASNEGLFDADPHLLCLRHLVSRYGRAAVALPNLRG